MLCSFSGLVWVTRTGLHALMIQKHIHFLILSSAAPTYFPSSPPLIGQLTDAWDSTAGNNRAAKPKLVLLCQRIHKAKIMQMCYIGM